MLMRFFRRLFVSLLLIVLAWAAGFFWFTTLIPTSPTEDLRTTDAIVVLTGGKGRIDYGLSLLSEGKAKKMFISGVGENATPKELIEQAVSRARRTFSLSPDAIIMLGYNATNTIGNAWETSQWMEKEGFASLRLVTANYHMPRSLLEFVYVMPGVTIIPDPVIPEGFRREAWWKLNGAGKLTLSEYHKYLAAKLRHWLIDISEDA